MSSKSIKYLWVPGLAVIISAALPALAYAAAPGSDAPDLMGAGLRMFGSLLLVIGGMLLILYLFKRLGAGKNGAVQSQDIIKVISTRYLAPKNFISVVEIGDSVLTLGVTADNITRLDKVPSSEFLSHTNVTKTDDFKTSFTSRLKSLANVGQFSLSGTK